jgi:hypothetical protein
LAVEVRRRGSDAAFLSLFHGAGTDTAGRSGQAALMAVRTDMAGG